MKIGCSKKYEIASLALAMTALLFIFISSCASKSKECKYRTNQVSSVSDFKSSNEWNKLDGRFKHAWGEAMISGESDKSFECLIKTETAPTDGQKKQLQDAGYAYRSVIGKIMTGSVIAKNVPEVAKLSFVKVMELAVPVSPK